MAPLSSFAHTFGDVLERPLSIVKETYSLNLGSDCLLTTNHLLEFLAFAYTISSALKERLPANYPTMPGNKQKSDFEVSGDAATKKD